ncbi:MAG: hypothetical protein OEZ32_04950 [Nitrospinota bacterium]|nr:hypothetical protein [Nitrospinota bacterium]
MQIKLNEEARKSIASAKSVALRLQSEELCAEHILLGVLSHPSAVVIEGLGKKGLKPSALSLEIMSNLPSGAGDQQKKDIPFSRSAKEVFQAASKEGDALRVDEIGPEHLMLGLLGSEKNPAFALMASAAGGRNAEIKAELKNILVRARKRRNMTELFNEHASTAIITAREEAKKNKSEFIEPEHILMGIVGHPGSVPMAALIRLKVNIKALNANLARIITQIPKRRDEKEGLSFSEDAKKAMDITISESESRGHKYIGPEHLMLGVVGVENSAAAAALKDAGLESLMNLREEIDHVLAAQR